MAHETETYRLALSSPEGVHRVLSVCRRRRYELLEVVYSAHDRTLDLSIANRRSRVERPGVTPSLLAGLTAVVEVLSAERLTHGGQRPKTRGSGQRVKSSQT